MDARFSRLKDDFFFSELLLYFNIPYRSEDVVTRQQAEYLVRYIGSRDMALLKETFAELERQFNISKRKQERLTDLYSMVKWHNMVNSQRYDMNTLRPPIPRNIADII